jgi:hypothetical protein
MAAIFSTKTMESIHEFTVPKCPTAFKLNMGNFLLDFYINAKPHSGKIYIFSPGFMRRDQFSLPFFQRLRWAEEIEATVIILSDPGLGLDENLGLSWFQGTRRDYFLPKVADVLRDIVKVLEVPHNRVMFYGSSAGGFASLMFASFVEGSCALVNNPQTNICRFLKGPVQALLDVCFDGISIDEASRELEDRFCVATHYRSLGVLPNILYVQNMFDQFHVDNHLQPFMEQIKSFSRIQMPADERAVIVLYRGHALNHDPLPISRARGYMALAESLFFK